MSSGHLRSPSGPYRTWTYSPPRLLPPQPQPPQPQPPHRVSHELNRIATEVAGTRSAFQDRCAQSRPVVNCLCRPPALQSPLSLNRQLNERLCELPTPSCFSGPLLLPPPLRTPCHRVPCLVAVNKHARTSCCHSNHQPRLRMNSLVQEGCDGDKLRLRCFLRLDLEPIDLLEPSGVGPRVVDEDPRAFVVVPGRKSSVYFLGP